jgi:hypothetical protein
MFSKKIIIKFFKIEELIVISVIVYVLRQNCRVAGWRRDSIIMLLWNKISKGDLVLTCGVAFLEMEWTSGSQSNKISYYLLSNEISNFLDEIPLTVVNRVVFHQDGAYHIRHA